MCVSKVPINMALEQVKILVSEKDSGLSRSYRDKPVDECVSTILIHFESEWVLRVQNLRVTNEALKKLLTLTGQNR